MEFEIFESKDGWRWHLRASNGKLVATSGEAFHDRFNAERAVKHFKRSFLNVLVARTTSVESAPFSEETI